MRKLFDILLIFVCGVSSSIGQTVTGASTDARGYKLYVYMTGLGTNGTFSLGWITNNHPSASNKVVVSIQKPGFKPISGGSPVPTNWPCTLYGTRQLRFPYPGDSFPETEVHGSGIRVAVGLTQYVFSEDTGLTLTLLSGLYSQGGSNSPAASGITVTNNSLQSYSSAKAIADFERTTSWNRWTNSPQRVYVKGGSGQRVNPPTSETLYRSLAGVSIIATDLFGNSVTNHIQDESIDTSISAMVPAGRYQADLVMTAMSNRSPVRIDFVAWPLVGSSNAVLDTRENMFTGVHSGPIAITNLWDPLQEYSSTVAIADPAGSDTTGTTTTTASYGSHTNFFLSIGKAAQSIRTNNAASGTWAHDDVGGGVVYVRDGVTNWLGSSQSYGTNPLANIRILPYPGHAPSLSAQSGNQDISDKIELDGMSITGTGNLFSSINYLTLRNCYINSSNSLALFATIPVCWLIDCEIPYVAGGLRPYSTQNTTFRLSNCDLDGFSGSLNPRTMVGCYHPQRAGSSAFVLQQDTSSAAAGFTDFFIWSDNIIAGLQNTSLAWYFGQNKETSYGGYIANNIFTITTNSGPAVYNFGGSVNYHTNIIIFHNIFIGKRAAGYMYNQVGTNITIREFIVTVGNLGENFGYKTDTFTGDGPADGIRTGNWPVMWGVGHHHNVHVNCDTTGVEAPASFVPYFYGTVSYHPLTAFTNTVTWPDMKDPRSVGYNSVEGIGNYHWNTTSPIGQQFQSGLVDIPIRFDLDGSQRSQSDPPGPYAADLRVVARNRAHWLRAKIITVR